MRHAGRITDWNDAKGYGFVTPNGGGERVFVHIKAFAGPGRRPAMGDLVSYEAQTDARGRRNAAVVRYAGVPARRAVEPRRAVPRRTLALAAFAALCVAWWTGRLPLIVVALYGVMSGLAFVLYALDKGAAERGDWRRKESTLHSAALLGGWPGALLAQHRYRHKTRKASFQAVFWLTVLLNGGAVAWWLHAAGAA
jgi:uncharacterized membrane protein YsdA (DUF1294 family)/cold shock CspA family protein